MARPLSAAAFARSMASLGPFEPEPTIAVALSGGGDSLALTLLLADWLRPRGGRLLALTVDHRLRPGATAEARDVAEMMAARGIGHEILTWRGAKPKTGVQARARRARYELLTNRCRRRGILHLCLAHHGGDQAETVAMRRARGSGAEGLAGMAPLVARDGVRLLRPLLSTPRDKLLAVNRAARLDWLDDPSNRDPRFERVRVRRRLAACAAERKDLRLLAEASAAKSEALRGDMARAFARGLRLHPAGFARLDRAVLVAAAPEMARAMLRRLALAIGGKPYPAGPAALEQTLATLLSAPPGRGPTLAGCRFVAGQDSVLICREKRHLPPSARLRPGSAVRWDRFVARLAPAADEGEIFHVGPLGADGWRRAREAWGPGVAASLPPPVRAVVPSLWRGGQLIAIPGLPAPTSEKHAFPGFCIEFTPLYPVIPTRPRHGGK